MKVYADVEKIQEVLWRGDDMIDQEDLFELQDLVANFALKVAQSEGKVEQLVKKFPWLYRKA